jgi:hypothetical protein
MKLLWILLPTFALSFFSAAPAHSAVVAVMPVKGVNLSDGQCDAIGVFFANAFARDANVAVASPMESRRAFEQSKSSQAAAAQLGVSEYVELRAIQLGKKVTLAGILYAKDGGELFRAETAAPSLDEMEMATARLSRALILRQPIPRMPPPEATVAEVPEAPTMPEAIADPNAYPRAFGFKTGLFLPTSSGRSFSPMMSLQFDGRVGNRDYFLEFGAGGALPTQDDYWSSTIRLYGFFAELGGSIYLSSGSTALYIGGGIAPGLWVSERYSNTNTGARCTVYGQAGINFSRDSRTRIYGEFRISQHILGFADSVSDGSLSGGTTTGNIYYPTILALQFGMGW